MVSITACALWQSVRAWTFSMPSSPRSATTSLATGVTPRVGARLVAAHDDHMLGTETLGRQQGERSDGAVARCRVPVG